MGDNCHQQSVANNALETSDCEDEQYLGALGGAGAASVATMNFKPLIIELNERTPEGFAMGSYKDCLVLGVLETMRK